jgi:hypothetical protein
MDAGEVSYGDDVLPVNQGADISPSAANPAAESWTDVLKFGLSRVIDARTRPVSPENTKATLQQAGPAATSPATAAGLVANPKAQQLALLLLAGVVIAAIVFKSRGA